MKQVLDEMFPEDAEDTVVVAVSESPEEDDTAEDDPTEESDMAWDPWDPKSIRDYIAAEVGRLVQLAQAAAAPPPTQPEPEKPALQSRAEQLAQFRAEHPDIDQYREQIKCHMAEYLTTPEEAYFACKAAEEEAVRRGKADTARTVRAIGGGSSSKVSDLEIPLSSRPSAQEIWDYSVRKVRERKGY